MVALGGVVVGSSYPDVTMSDTQGFGLLGTASADGHSWLSPGEKKRPGWGFGRTRDRGTYSTTLKGTVHLSSF